MSSDPAVHTTPVERSTEDFEAAHAIALRLAAEAVWSGELCAFHGAAASEVVGGPAVYKSFGGDLYEGSAGIARFLGLMAHLAQDDLLRRTALGALAHADERSSGWSMFSGRTGVGLVTLELARLLDRPDLVTSAVQAIEAGSEEALGSATYGPFDLLSGTAGVVHVLVTAAEYDLDGGWTERARALGKALLQCARRTETGWSWPMMPGSADHLCGFGHGSAGIAFALSELARIDPGDGDWQSAASQARTFERQWFSPAHGSWADLRSEGRPAGTKGFAYPHFWCHGSVGIGFDRLMAVSSGSADLFDRADALAALAGARASAEQVLAGPAGPGAGFDANGSQCHGLGGMIDLFAEAWLVDPDPALLRLCRSLTAFMRNDAGPEGRWRCGVPGGTETPGLMLGLAGIGWAHLRAWNPKAVPPAWTPRLTPSPA